MNANNYKIPVKERRFLQNHSNWIIPTNTDIKVTFKTHPRQFTKTIIRSSDAVDIIRPIWPDIDHYESFMVIYINRANKVIGAQLVSTGGITGTVADPRIILQTALLVNATSIMLTHNHPSGNLQPSRADEEITKKIKEAASYHDITVTDHLIITNDSFFSFADEGLL